MARRWVERWLRESNTLDQDPSAIVQQRDQHSDHGELQSLEQLANWVRFADTKATILFAGLGVALTLSLSSAAPTARILERGGPGATVVGSMAAVAAMAFLWTLGWLLHAISPSRTTGSRTPNRFAWPTLLGLDPDDLNRHLDRVDLATDARSQCLDLARLAQRKYRACTLAIWGFGLFLIFTVATVLATVIATL